MKKYAKLAVAAVVAAGASLMASSAMAWIVCNPADHVCWHTHHHYAYHPEWGLVVHPDGWVWAPGETWAWHEPPQDRPGYWRGGVWIRL